MALLVILCKCHHNKQCLLQHSSSLWVIQLELLTQGASQVVVVLLLQCTTLLQVAALGAGVRAAVAGAPQQQSCPPWTTAAGNAPKATLQLTLQQQLPWQLPRQLPTRWQLDATCSSSSSR
jgi:hypothetical protein